MANILLQLLRLKLSGISPLVDKKGRYLGQCPSPNPERERSYRVYRLTALPITLSTLRLYGEMVVIISVSADVLMHQFAFQHDDDII
jgi:hypothetical protein